MLGGGPAGASAAKLLSEWGHAVRLITRPATDAHLAVSIPPSCQKLFDAIGVGDAIDRAGFVRATGNTVWWGHVEPRVERFADGARGWQASMHVLEDVLLAEAAGAGVEIERRAIAEDDLTLRADRFVIDATGRSGVLARAMGVRAYDEGPRTVALAASWTRTDTWPVPDDTHTLVEAYASGWAWSVPTAPGARHIAVMVDPRRSGLARETPARDVYLAEIAKTAAFRRLVEGANCTDGPWGWDATGYRADRYAGEGWLFAGDAGSFIDPLSSAGVKKALASGWLAAVVVHTILARPEMRGHALAFFSAREQEIEGHQARMARLFLAEAAPTHSHAFWRDRSDPPEAPVGVDAAAVRQAYEQLRAAPTLQLGPGQTRIEPRASIHGHEIALEPHIVSGDESIRFVAGVDVVAVLDLGPRFSQVPDLFETYCRAHGTVPLPDFLRALATAVARGWLVAQ